MEDIDLKFEIVGTMPERILNYSLTVFDKKIYIIGMNNKYIIKIYLFDGEIWENIEIKEIKSDSLINSIVFNDNLYIFLNGNKYIKYDKKNFHYNNLFIDSGVGVISCSFIINKCIVLYYWDLIRSGNWYNFDPDTNKIEKSDLKLPFSTTNFNRSIKNSNYLYLKSSKLLKFNILTKEISEYDLNINFYSLVCYNDIIYVIGGKDSQNYFFIDTISIFDTNDPNPSLKITKIKMNEKKRNVETIIYNDAIYVIGGEGESYNEIHTVEKYNLKPLQLIKLKKPIINEAKITQNIHKSFVYSTVYNNNYNQFISTSGDSTLILWNIERTNTEITDITIEKILTGHTDRVVCVAWNLDSKECASGSNDCSVIVWNTDSGSIIKKYDDHSDIVRSVHYNNEGTLASASDDKTIIIYNKEKIILQHKNRVRCIKWNLYNEKLLLSGCDDFSIRLWDVSKKTIIRTFREHSNFIYSLVWKDETIFASSSGDETIKIWNTDEEKSTKVLTDHEGNVWSIDWKGDVLVSGGNDKKILVWDTTNYTNQELTGHDGYVLSVNIDNNSNIISGGTDNIINVWNIF